MGCATTSTEELKSIKRPIPDPLDVNLFDAIEDSPCDSMVTSKLSEKLYALSNSVPMDKATSRKAKFVERYSQKVLNKL
jgi:hypothetical protein